MVLRLLLYWGLCVDAIIRHEFLTGLICLGIPFMGRTGMWVAVLVGMFFFIAGYYIEGSLSIGCVIFNLVGNHLWDKYTTKSVP
jgi:hypothetical protein